MSETKCFSREVFFNYFGDKSCYLAAIAIATNLPREYILAETVKVVPISAINSRGTSLREARDILRRVGKDFKVHYADDFDFCRSRNRKYDKFYDRREAEKPKFIREQEFKRKFSQGTFIVVNRDHAWTIKDGFVHDPLLGNSQTSKRQIEYFIEIF